MKNNLLRIEAVNLASTIDDTEDLSTRRGGGYMLLDAIRDIERKYQDKIRPISNGASIGLFEMSDPQIDPGVIRDYLRGHERYRHATFVVDAVRQDSFRQGVEMALAANRWQQMQSLSFSNVWGEGRGVCDTDEIRPATSGRTSMSVAARRAEGRNLRQGFYQRELGIASIGKRSLDESSFTNDTGSLSEMGRTSAYASLPGNLNGKMVVFYADGNGFGKIQQACASADQLRQWDEDLKEKRRQLLRELLAWLDATPLGKTYDNRLRFETLLWGGDEMLFLLPAWLGLEFAQQFFALTAGWKHGNTMLTHAAGIVFASHSAPISQLQKLAKNLAEQGKRFDRGQNTLSWIVLESFDRVGDNLDGYWERNGIMGSGWEKLLLTPKKLADLRFVIPGLKDELPRSAMVRVLCSLAASKTQNEIGLLQRSYQSTDQALGESKKPFEALWQSLCGSTWQSKPDSIPESDAVAWTVLLELWDYLQADAQTNTQGAAQ